MLKTVVSACIYTFSKCMVSSQISYGLSSLLFGMAGRRSREEAPEVILEAGIGDTISTRNFPIVMLSAWIPLVTRLPEIASVFCVSTIALSSVVEAVRKCIASVFCVSTIALSSVVEAVRKCIASVFLCIEYRSEFGCRSCA